MAHPDHLSRRTNFSTEIELLLHCARTHLEVERSQCIRSLVQTGIDWESLLQAATQHGVAPLLYQQLHSTCHADVPASVMLRLKDIFVLNSVRNQRLIDELCSVLRLLENNGVLAVPYKGPALASAIYGDINLRQFNDLDLMISPKDIQRVSGLLLAQGYSQQWLLSPRQERAYLDSDCERLFSRDGAFLDVHWAVVRSYLPLKIDLSLYRERLISISLGECAIKSFAPEDQLNILCVHASKDLWGRLIWLCDIAELLRAYPQMEWNRIQAETKSAGTFRILLLGLYLAQTLLDADLPREMAQRAETDGVVRALAEQVKRSLFETQSSAAGSLSEFNFYLKLLEGLPTKMKYVVRYGLTTNPADWDFAQLPDSLFFLYSIIRPWRLLSKRLWRSCA